MEDKIFGYTREELVDMFEPLTEIQEKASDMVMDMQKDSNTKRLYVTSTTEYKKNTLLWLQQKIMGTRMSKKDKEEIIDWIGSTINMAFDSGYASHIKETGCVDEIANGIAKCYLKVEE